MNETLHKALTRASADTGVPIYELLEDAWKYCGGGHTKAVIAQKSESKLSAEERELIAMFRTSDEQADVIRALLRHWRVKTP